MRNLGKPVALCKRYYDEGADEVVFLNITSFRQVRQQSRCIYTTGHDWMRWPQRILPVLVCPKRFSMC